MPFEIVADDILRYVFVGFFSEEIRLGISCELSSRQVIQINVRPFFFTRKKKKKKKK